ncbi:MAG: hypothetical protein RR922_01550 [Clostridia bacterium]
MLNNIFNNIFRMLGINNNQNSKRQSQSKRTGYIQRSRYIGK